jgi:hypothetical protein
MCAGLADLFPDDFKKELAEAKVVAQSVIILRIPTFNVTYDKFVVLITSSVDGDEIATVCVNTNPSPRNNHIVIKSVDYDFLDYNSHVDCSTIIPFSKAYLKQLLEKEPDRYKGELSEAEYIDVIMKLSQSESITEEDRERFNL